MLMSWQVSTSVSSSKEMEQLEAKQTALYGRAQGVFKNVGFMCFMMWMSGSQIHLFSIMMTVSGIYQPLMAIMNSRQSETLSETAASAVFLGKSVLCRSYTIPGAFSCPETRQLSPQATSEMQNTSVGTVLGLATWPMHCTTHTVAG